MIANHMFWINKELHIMLLKQEIDFFKMWTKMKKTDFIKYCFEF